MKTKSSEPSLRRIPAVEKVLQEVTGYTDLPRAIVVAVVRRELAKLRKRGDVPEFASIIDQIQQALRAVQLSRIQPVINGTGILVHTNLGRAPLGREVVAKLATIAGQYNNLEYDLISGERGGRAEYLEEALALLCEAEAATIVNNCAAALVLILRHFTSSEKREVIISRGELVQIGGGFRIPDILEASGAILREVGTTNKTALADYETALGQNTGLILKVHRSNFFMGGFVESPSTEDLARLAQSRQVPFVEDLGSGAIVETASIAGVEHEPTPAEVLRRGVDLVCFSGDKLLGGPQAGVIAGKADRIKALKREPFFRALRCDRLILTAMQATVDIYLSAGDQSDVAFRSIPILHILQLPASQLQERAEAMAASLAGVAARIQIGSGDAQIGGGTLPRSVVKSVTLDLIPAKMSMHQFAQRLRSGNPPLIGYISGQRFKIDLRTVLPEQDELVVDVIRRVLGGEVGDAV